jgi:pseudouridine-5'-phosphate glycosidase
MTITFADDVADALRAGAPVVALESTLICHGFPPPDNLEVALEIEAAVRTNGAVPATIAVLGGQMKVGLNQDELRRLAQTPEAAKCTTRDLPLALARGGSGATTVAATLAVAAKAGIEVMATGGLGGVHQGGEHSLDVSADLEQLARSRLAVVCSGAKSILDLPRTMERLESLGVAVVGYGCDELPGFYSTGSGLPVPRVDGVHASAACSRRTAISASRARWSSRSRRRQTPRWMEARSIVWSRVRGKRRARPASAAQPRRPSCCAGWRMRAAARRYASIARWSGRMPLLPRGWRMASRSARDPREPA